MPTEVLHQTGRYRVRLARDAADLRRAQELRFAVFNLELDEGLAESWERGYDEDAFDAPCDHLLVEDTTGCDGSAGERVDAAVVGTYRLQPARNAGTPPGLYTAGEFDLSDLAPLFGQAVEAGRACIHSEHRNTRVLQLLWQGLGSYMLAHQARYLFGCCSLTSQDPEEARATWRWLAKHRHLHPTLGARPRPEYECFPPGAARGPGPVARGVPTLFSSYLRIGTKVAGEPALDRQFKTIDFLALLDVHDLSLLNRRRFLR
jgi:putative hemolysin